MRRQWTKYAILAISTFSLTFFITDRVILGGMMREPERHPPVTRQEDDPFYGYLREDKRSCCSTQDCVAAQSCFKKIDGKVYLGWFEENNCNLVPEDRLIIPPERTCNWVLEKGYDMVVCRRRLDEREMTVMGIKDSPAYRVYCAYPCVSS